MKGQPDEQDTDYVETLSEEEFIVDPTNRIDDLDERLRSLESSMNLRLFSLEESIRTLTDSLLANRTRQPVRVLSNVTTTRGSQGQTQSPQETPQHARRTRPTAVGGGEASGRRDTRYGRMDSIVDVPVVPTIQYVKEADKFTGKVLTELSVPAVIDFIIAYNDYTAITSYHAPPQTLMSSGIKADLLLNHKVKSKWGTMGLHTFETMRDHVGVMDTLREYVSPRDINEFMNLLK